MTEAAALIWTDEPEDREDVLAWAEGRHKVRFYEETRLQADVADNVGRPVLKALVDDVKAGDYGLVLVPDLIRFGPSVSRLIRTMSDLIVAGSEIVAVRDRYGLRGDYSRHARKLVLLLARSHRAETGRAIREGQEKSGNQGGPDRLLWSTELIEKVHALLRAGETASSIARKELIEVPTSGGVVRTPSVKAVYRLLEQRPLEPLGD